MFLYLGGWVGFHLLRSDLAPIGAQRCTVTLLVALHHSTTSVRVSTGIELFEEPIHGITAKVRVHGFGIGIVPIVLFLGFSILGLLGRKGRRNLVPVLGAMAR